MHLFVLFFYTRNSQSKKNIAYKFKKSVLFRVIRKIRVQKDFVAIITKNPPGKLRWRIRLSN